MPTSTSTSTSTATSVPVVIDETSAKSEVKLAPVNQAVEPEARISTTTAHRPSKVTVEDEADEDEDEEVENEEEDDEEDLDDLDGESRFYYQSVNQDNPCSAALLPICHTRIGGASEGLGLFLFFSGRGSDTVYDSLFICTSLIIILILSHNFSTLNTHNSLL